RLDGRLRRRGRAGVCGAGSALTTSPSGEQQPQRERRAAEPDEHTRPVLLLGHRTRSPLDALSACPSTLERGVLERAEQGPLRTSPAATPDSAVAVAVAVLAV